MLLSAVLDALASSSSNTSSSSSWQAPERGLSEQDFDSLLVAICESKSSSAAIKAIPLLVPNRTTRLHTRHVELILGSFSRTSDAALRSAWARYLSAWWDSGLLLLNTKDTLHAGYGVLFYVLLALANNSAAQTDVCRLVYRLTRHVDVTGVRCHQLTRAMAKPQPAPSMVALSELFCALHPDLCASRIAFPAVENAGGGGSSSSGIGGGHHSGLTLKASQALHRSVGSTVRDAGLVRHLVRCSTATTTTTTTTTTAPDNNNNAHIAERAHSVKRPRLRADGVSMNQEEEDEEEESADDNDNEAWLMAELATWDGVHERAEVERRLAHKLAFPQRKPRQDELMQRVFRPLLLLATSGAAPLPVLYSVCRSLGRMVGRWVATEEKCGQYAVHVLGAVDDALCQLLASASANASEVHVCAHAFYHPVSQGLLQRPKPQSPLPSAAVKLPSEYLAHSMLLSPSLLGVSNMCDVLLALLPVYRVEGQAGEQTRMPARVQASRMFEAIAQDFCKALVLGRAHQVFESSSTLLRGKELLVGTSLATRAAWQVWREDRGEEEEKEESVDEAQMAAFLLWLKHERGVPALCDLVAAVSVRFRRLIDPQQLQQEEGEAV